MDCDGGYTGMTQEDFVRVMKVEAARNHYTGPYLACIDHGGPWLKDIQTLEMWPYEKAMEGVKRSYEAALLAGYELIHVDPTVDRFLPKGQIIDIEVVAARTIELITHIENFRKERGIAPIAYEVGTEEVAVDLYVIVEYGIPIQRAAADAQELLASDPGLEKPENAGLKATIDQTFATAGELIL